MCSKAFYQLYSRGIYSGNHSPPLQGEGKFWSILKNREEFEGVLTKKLKKSAKTGKNLNRAGGGGILRVGQNIYPCFVHINFVLFMGQIE